MGYLGKAYVASWALVVVVCLSGGADATAQQPAPDSACSLAPPTFVSGAPNIFNDQQEQYLGDAMAEKMEAELRLAPVGADDPLTRIGQRLLATLPPSGLQYRFRIYDSGELNAFSLGGGRVYISRKMLAAVKNEDELAGIVAHEIGHIATHQFATEFTRTFRIRLGVTQVTDRADIFARVHQMLSTSYKSAEGEAKEDKDQLLADHAALYAMVRAGYAPESFVTFLDKLTVNKGKTGNAFTDFFGATHEASQRYRSGLKLIAALPPGCKGQPPVATEKFLAWQHSMVEERLQTGAGDAEGDTKIALGDPLRPELWNIRFSLDGSYVLAQDQGGINIVDRAGSRFMFRIDAPDVGAAQFTPDSANVVFDDDSLRVERWSVATGKRTSVKELVVFEGCDQRLLSPDGTTLVCFHVNDPSSFPKVGVRMIDVDTGKPYFEKANFYEPTGYAITQLIINLELKDITGMNLVNVAVSQEGRYMMAALGNREMAFDFEHRQPVTLSGKLHGIGQVRMAFLEGDQLYARGELGNDGYYKARIYSFPDGRQMGESKIGDQQIGPISKGAMIRAWPTKSYAVGIFDPVSAKMSTASRTDAINVWENFVAVEGPAGGLQLGGLGLTGSKLVALPLGKLPRPTAATFSPDGKYLAVSLKARGELWNLSTGKRVSLMRPFRSVWMDDKDNLIAQYLKFQEKDAVQMRMTIEPLSAKELGKFEEDDWQYRDMELKFRPNGKDKSKTHNAVVEMKKMDTQAVAWSKSYPHEMPACWNAEDDRLVLAWDLSNDTAKAEIKGSVALQKETEGLKDKKRGLLLETVVPETGAPLEQVVIPEADLSHGWADSRHAMVSGEYVLVRGEHGNTVIYRMDTGGKVGEFFGLPVATDASIAMIAATNREDEIVLLDESTGKELKRFTLGSPVRLARIIAGKENELLVLTADQVVHRMALPAKADLTAQTGK